MREGISESILPRKRKLSTAELVVCALFTALTAIGAFIQIPIPNLDYFTLQFFFVILSGILLGSKLGATAVAVYVALGLFGIPIFAAGGGISYIFRPSFGYLLGFIAASFVTGFLCERWKTKTTLHYFIGALGGFFVTYLIGIAYKYMILKYYADTPITLGAVLLSCFPLDMPGDLLLCGLAAFVGKRLEKVRIGRS